MEQLIDIGGRAILEWLMGSVNDHVCMDIKKDTLLYRARRIKEENMMPVYKDGESGDYLCSDWAHSSERNFYGYNKRGSHVVRKKKITAGRLNTISQQCLYLATAESVAIAEMRPFRKCEYSLATVVVKQDLKLLDLRIKAIADSVLSTEKFQKIEAKNSIVAVYEEEPMAQILAELLARPCETNDTWIYEITQRLAASMLFVDFDGIIYTSSLSEDGDNVAMFRCESEDDGVAPEIAYDRCEPISSKIMMVDKLGFCATDIHCEGKKLKSEPW